MKYFADEIATKWAKPARSFNQKLVQKRLQELALSGVYFDSCVIN